MRDLRQRIRLIHELGQLRRSEKLSHGSDDGLRIDEIVRHGRNHFLIYGHLFLDRTFHANQTDAELILEQFTDSADTAIAEVIDVIHLTDILAKLQQVGNDSVEIRRFQNSFLERRCQIQLDVELETADFREIVFARIEEHSFEEGCRGLECRRISGPQFSIDFDQSFLRRLDRVLAQGLAQYNTDVVALRKKNRKFGYAGVDDLTDDVLRQLVVGFDDDLARVGVDDIADGKRAFEVFRIDFESFDLGLLDVAENGFRDFLPGVNKDFFGLWIRDVLRHLQSFDVVGNTPEDLLAFDGQPVRLVEGTDDFLIALQSERAEENGRQKFPLAVDADIQNVLRRFVF